MCSASVQLRPATLTDIPALRHLIAVSARGLSRGDYSEAQIEAALRSAFGVDTQLIRDGTYFLAEADGAPIACGGWSFRRTLYGGDDQPDRQADALDPAHEAARIRAFFVHPAWSRRGLGRTLLARCEDEAHAHGFKATALLATLPGLRLYSALGYTADPPREYPLPDGTTITFVPMLKSLR